MTREQLLRHLRTTVLHTPRLVEAFSAVDRADFVPIDYSGEAYEDHALPLGFGSTISQPSTVAIMLELLQPQPGHSILDVGSGSGWTTALLGFAVGGYGKVIGVELVPELVKISQKSLAKYDMPQVTLMEAQANNIGLPERVPFDRILVSAASQTLPQELVDQLKIGGTIVIPIQSSIYKISKISPEKIETQELPGFAFVPLR